MPVNNPPATNANTVLTNLYEHPGYYYRLSYPEGWQVTQRDTNGAIIAPPGGIQASRIGGLNGESTRMVDNVGTGVILSFCANAVAESAQVAAMPIAVNRPMRNTGFMSVPLVTGVLA